MSKEGDHSTPKHQFEHDVKLAVETRVRQGVKAVLEEILQEEMTQHLESGPPGADPPPSECEPAGHRDSAEELREVGVEELPHDGYPRNNGRAKPTLSRH